MKGALFPVGSFYPAQTGGPDNTVYWITKALKQMNYDPIIVASERGLQETVARNRWLETNYGKVIYTTNLIHYFPLRLIWMALTQIRKVDVIHLAMIFYPASFIIATINQIFYQKPVLWSVHGDLDPYMLLRSSWKKRPVLWLINTFLKKNVWFHATCDAEVQYLKDVFGSDIKIVLIPNYMEFSEEIKIEKEDSFFYIGRIHPKKAIENLIEALHVSKHFRGSGYQLKIAGNHHNPYGESLVAQAKALDLEDQVLFLGHVEGDQKQELLAQSKFSFMPSHTENCGIVVMEAMAQSTPVVASTGTPWEILNTEKAGFWSDNDPETLAKVIDQILTMSSDEYQEYVKNARRLAYHEFNIYQKIDTWENAYREAIHP